MIARLTSENSIVVSVKPCSKFSAWVPGKRFVRKKFGELALVKGIEVAFTFSIKNHEALPAIYFPSLKQTETPESSQNIPL